MKETHEFLVPDYFSDFSCKMGKCRSACCIGWTISFSRDDYFRLVSMNCGAKFRKKLDCAFHPSENPTPEKYVAVSPKYDGNCPLRLEDGRCGIHAEFGEDYLAAVCRLYPRGIRCDGGFECSCANSCEAVLELLFGRNEPICFEKKEFSFEIPPQQKRFFRFETFGYEQEIRLWLIKQLQNRKLPLPQRLMMLGLSLKEIEDSIAEKDKERLKRILAFSPAEISKPPVIFQSHLEFGLKNARALLKLMDDRSASIRSFGEEALDYFGSGEGALERYKKAKELFEKKFPDWEIRFEHMLVNHMFFEQFPFQDRPESFWNEFVGLCAVYALLRFLCVGWMARRENPEDFVDVAAAAFRLIDHTEFERYSSQILRSFGCTDPQKIYDLITL